MKCLLLVSLVVFASAEIKRRQNVTISGTVLCRGKPVPNIPVELKEKDYFSRDDLLSETHTDDKGRFEVSGSDNEVFNIAPYVVFHHSCSVLPNCQGESTYSVPSDAIGTHYNLTVDLSIKEEGDKHVC